MRASARIILVAGYLAHGGCERDLGIAGVSWPCRTDSECGTGMACPLGYCVPDWSFDGYVEEVDPNTDVTAGGDVDTNDGEGQTDADDPLVPPHLAQIAAGGNHTCALDDAGQVWCWGSNTYGQLGYKTTDYDYSVHAFPQAIDDDQRYAEIRAGDYHTCGRVSGGGVRCWGRNHGDYESGGGQLGNGTLSDSSRAFDVVGIDDASELALGAGHSCARLREGTVWCWGDNRQGQLGSDGSALGFETTPVEVVGLVGRATTIAAGGDHTCAIVEGGSLACWGANSRGELGSGASEPRFTATLVPLLDEVTGVALGPHHACVVQKDERIRCWGDNAWSQLGVAGVQIAEEPQLLPGYAASSVLAGGGAGTGTARSCLLSTDREAACWGHGGYGALGCGTPSDPLSSNATPCQVRWSLRSGQPGEALSPVQSLSLGGGHTCAVTADGDGFCFGVNWSGQLGNGAEFSVPRPRRVERVTGAISVAVGDGTCVLSGAGTVSCWNSAVTGLDALEDVTSIAGEPWYGRTCAVSERLVFCWGLLLSPDYSGIQVTRPTRDADVDDAIEVSVGSFHTCVRTTENRVKCWGDNSSGALGDGTLLPRTGVVSVPGLVGVSSVAAGSGGTCAVTYLGAVYCWGRQAVVGSSWSKPIPGPTLIEGIDNAESVVTAGSTYCVRLLDGTGRCWGAGLSQSGTGLIDPPVRLLALDNIRAIFQGTSHSCASIDDGTLRCWGRNDQGQLGDGTYDDSEFSIEVLDLANVRSVGLGKAHSCAALEDGSVSCWGKSAHGELGDGNDVNSVFPVPLAWRRDALTRGRAR